MTAPFYEPCQPALLKMSTTDWRSLYPFASHELRIGGLKYHYLEEGSGPVLLGSGSTIIISSRGKGTALLCPYGVYEVADELYRKQLANLGVDSYNPGLLRGVAQPG